MVEVTPAFHDPRKTLIFVHDQIEYTMLIYKDIISIEDGKRGGKPCIREMRITVEDILRWLASGMSVDDILLDFPELTKEDVFVALEFSANQQKRIFYGVAA